MSKDRAVTFWVSITLGGICAFVVVSTFLPLGWVIPTGLTLTLFVLVFPLFAVGLAREVSGDRGADLSALLGRLPSRQRVLLGVAWLALCLSVASSFLGPQGQPMSRNGRLVLNNHGVETAVDQDTYDRALNRDARGFLSVGAAFCLVVALLSKHGGPEAPNGDGPTGTNADTRRDP